MLRPHGRENRVRQILNYHSISANNHSQDANDYQSRDVLNQGKSIISCAQRQKPA
jgi:hypothetical protein